jgi:hypothetical protein
MNGDAPELTEFAFARAIRGAARRRLCTVDVHGGKEVAAVGRIANRAAANAARAIVRSAGSL